MLEPIKRDFTTRTLVVFLKFPVYLDGIGTVLIGALLRRNSQQDAVEYGCACGALTATRFGAQPSLPTAEEVRNYLRTA